MASNKSFDSSLMVDDGVNSYTSDEIVQSKPSVTEVLAVNNDAFMVDKKYVNASDLNFSYDENVIIYHRDVMEKEIDDVPAVDKVVSDGNNALVLWESGKIVFNGIHAKSIVDVAGNKIIFIDLAAKLSNYVCHSSPAYSRFISLILEKALGDNYVVSDGSALNIPVIESCLVSQDVEGLDMCDIVYDGSSSVELNDSEMIQMVNTKTMSGLLDPNSTETSDVYPFKVPTNRLSEDVIG
ncbi:hypothetical protein Tco_1390648, partial [Tanacetum coccineum]